MPIGPAQSAKQQLEQQHAADLGLIYSLPENSELPRDVLAAIPDDVFVDSIADIKLAYDTPRYLGTRPEFGSVLPYHD